MKTCVFWVHYMCRKRVVLVVFATQRNSQPNFQRKLSTQRFLTFDSQSNHQIWYISTMFQRVGNSPQGCSCESTVHFSLIASYSYHFDCSFCINAATAPKVSLITPIFSFVSPDGKIHLVISLDHAHLKLLIIDIDVVECCSLPSNKSRWWPNLFRIQAHLASLCDFCRHTTPAGLGWSQW